MSSFELGCGLYYGGGTGTTECPPTEIINVTHNLNGEILEADLVEEVFEVELRCQE